MVLKYQGLDVYFHMSNHYKKLRNVKSVIDSCPPKGKDGGSRGRPAIRPHSHICSTPKSARRRGEGLRHPSLKRHDCLSEEQKGLVYARSASLPGRPPTRRNPSDFPNYVQVHVRVNSSSPPRRNVSQNTETKVSPRKNSKNQKKKGASNSAAAEKADTPIVVYQNTSAFNKRPVSSSSALTETTVSDVPSGSLNSNKRTGDNDSRSNKSPSSEKSGGEGSVAPVPAPRTLSKVEEKRDSSSLCIRDHEYIQFSLRITEDIIRNELYTSKEMKRVFNSHIEANRGRLDMEKMKQQIEQLSHKLSVSLQHSEDSATPSKSEVKKVQQTIQDNLVCICKKEIPEDQDCECTSIRSAPFRCKQHPQEETEVSELPDKDEEKKSTESDQHSCVKTDIRADISNVNGFFVDKGSLVAVTEGTNSSSGSHGADSEEKQASERSTDQSDTGSGSDAAAGEEQEPEEFVMKASDVATQEELACTADDNMVSSVNECNCNGTDAAKNAVQTQAVKADAVRKSESQIRTYKLLEAQSLYVTQDGVHSADSITPINKCNCKEKEALKNTRERSDSEVRTYKLLEAQSLFVTSKYVSPSKKAASKCTCTVEAKSTCTCIEDAIKNQQSISPDICAECTKLKSAATSTTSLIIDDNNINNVNKHPKNTTSIPNTPLRSVNAMDSTRSTAGNADEYILLPGPIYVPKSSIQFTINSYRPSDEGDPTNYSFLHGKADHIKHDISMSSYYDKKPAMPGTNIPVLESAIFREPPKCMSLYQRSGDNQEATTPTFSCEKVYENFEYDVTPQKECMDEYYVDFKDAATSISNLGNVEIQKKESITDNLLNVDMNLDVFKLFQVNKETMTKNDTLLLGDDYRVDPENESALPYPISLFYPSTSTQTCLEDSRNYASAVIIPKMPERKLSPVVKPPIVVQEIKPEPMVEKPKPEIAHPKRESFTDVESKKGWSIIDMLKETPEEVVSPQKIEEAKERWSVDEERGSIEEVEARKQSIESTPEEEDTSSNESIIHTPPPSKADSLDEPLKEMSFHGMVITSPEVTTPAEGDGDSDFLAHLDEAPSLIVSESQQFAIEKAISDLDKVRNIGESERKSSLKVIADTVEDEQDKRPPRISIPNLLFQEEESEETVVIPDPSKMREKPEPPKKTRQPEPSKLPQEPESDIETVCCGLKKVKKKKEAKAASRDDVEEEGPETVVHKVNPSYDEPDTRRKSIRFEGEKDLSGVDRSADDFKSPFADVVGGLVESSSTDTMQSAAVQKSTEPSVDDIPATRHSNYKMSDAASIDTRESQTVEPPMLRLNEMQALRQDIIKRNSMQAETETKKAAIIPLQTYGY